jgi:hypothetical protein
MSLTIDDAILVHAPEDAWGEPWEPFGNGVTNMLHRYLQLARNLDEDGGSEEHYQMLWMCLHTDIQSLPESVYAGLHPGIHFALGYYRRPIVSHIISVALAFAEGGLAAVVGYADLEKWCTAFDNHLWEYLMARQGYAGYRVQPMPPHLAAEEHVIEAAQWDRLCELYKTGPSRYNPRFDRRTEMEQA